MTWILTIAAIIILFILIWLTKLTYKAAHLQHDLETEQGPAPLLHAVKQRTTDIQNYFYLGIILCFIALLFLIWYAVQGSIYAGHVQEWMNLIVRWLHITFGIAWIGASFLFVFMENSLKPNKDRPELKGQLWMLHGGGFFFVEKYKVAPAVLPKKVHWFKYEAYFTWLTGMGLLFVVYYFNAQAMLIDPNVLDMSSTSAILLGVGSLSLGYLIYDLLSRTPLLKKPALFGIVMFMILVGFAYFYTQVFSGRAAFIHFGALIGTIMAGNVFFVIIPAQKAMVKAAREGTYLDPWLGQYAGLRSYHNNYFTLPVLFVMISNHFPSTFGHDYAWAVLAGISLASGAIKHYANLREKEQLSYYVLPVGILMMLGVAFMSAPVSMADQCKEEVNITQVYTIVNQRCMSCHATQPTDEVWTSPPNGIVFDTPEDIAKQAERILQRVVITKTMPLNNQTGMTAEERLAIACWIEQGARVE